MRWKLTFTESLGISMVASQTALLLRAIQWKFKRKYEN
jgi:hypothetical protein